MKLKKVMKHVASGAALCGGIVGVYSYIAKSQEKDNLMLKRYKKYYQVTSSWITHILSGDDYIKRYLDLAGYEKVAVYGMGSIAEMLSKQFEHYEDKEIKYYIDRNGRELYYGLNGLEVIDIDGIPEMEKVDVIIVTAVADYDEILSDISQKVKDIKVVSLEEIV